MGKTVTLTAGHSNTDPGAVNGSDREADLAQDMRNIVASILRDDYGLTVKTDGTGKGNMPLRLVHAEKQTLVSGIEQGCFEGDRLETARRRRL